MCLMAPGRVVAVDGTAATVDVDGRLRTVSLLAEPGVVVGDRVVVAADMVVRRLDPATADEMQDAVRLASTEPVGAGTDGKGIDR